MIITKLVLYVGRPFGILVYFIFILDMKNVHLIITQTARFCAYSLFTNNVYDALCIVCRGHCEDSCFLCVNLLLSFWQSLLPYTLMTAANFSLGFFYSRSAFRSKLGNSFLIRSLFPYNGSCCTFVIDTESFWNISLIKLYFLTRIQTLGNRKSNISCFFNLLWRSWSNEKQLIKLT